MEDSPRIGETDGPDLPWRARSPAQERFGAPFQYSDIEYVILAARFDEAALRSLLPAGMEPAETMSGGFCFAAGRSPESPVSKACVWIDVKGFDSPDGTRGRFGVRLMTEGSFADAFRNNGNAVVDGGAVQHSKAGLAYASAATSGGEVFRAAVRPKAGAGKAASYYHYYLGPPSQSGSARIVPLAVTNQYIPAEPLFFENLAPAGDPLARLVPRAFLWAARPRAAVFTYGSPSGPDAAGDQRLAAARLVELIGRLGRGAFWVDGDGRVLGCNRAGEALLGDGLRLAGPRLVAADRAAHRLIEALIAAAATGAPPAGLRPIPLPRPSGRKPLLLQAVPLGGGSHDTLDIADPRRRDVLLLLTDPERPIGGDVARQLELFGLTPAEARLAALVGSGRSAVEAARSLRLSEGSARVSLARAYAKLSVSRQSELALLVARVEAAG